MSEADDPKSVINQNRLVYSHIAAKWERRRTADYDYDFHDQCRALFLSQLKGMRVLDVGCGLGLDSLAFATAGLQVTAADIVTGLLTAIRSKAQRIDLVAMDMTAPCFRPGCFDGIFACASFLHVPRELAGVTLAEFARILSPRGILFLHHVMSSRGLSGYRVDELLIPDNPAVCYCHDEQEIAELLAVAGLRVLAVNHLLPSKHPSPCAARNGLEPYQLIAGK